MHYHFILYVASYESWQTFLLFIKRGFDLPKHLKTSVAILSYRICHKINRYVKVTGVLKCSSVTIGQMYYVYYGPQWWGWLFRVHCTEYAT